MKLLRVVAALIVLIGLGLAVRTYCKKDQPEMILEITFDTNAQSNVAKSLPISIDRKTATAGSLLDNTDFVAKAYELNKLSNEKSSAPIFNQAYFVKDRGEKIFSFDQSNLGLWKLKLPYSPFLPTFK